MTDWDKIKKEVNEKIVVLEALDESQEGTVLHPNIMRDLIMPAVTHLARFCECVQEEHEPDQGGDDEQLNPTAG